MEQRQLGGDGLHHGALLEAHDVARVGDEVGHLGQLLHRAVEQHPGAVDPPLLGLRQPRGELEYARVDEAEALLRDVTRRLDQVQRARDEGVEHLERALRLLEQRLGARLAHTPPRVVADEAARVVEGLLPLVVHLVRDVAVDEQRHDLARLGAEAHGHVLDDVARAQGLEDLEDELLLVGAELHDRLSDVLLRGVTQHVELGLVSPHDVAGAAQPVQGDRRVLEEVDELGVLLPLLQNLVGARVAVQRDLACVLARTDEPVEVCLDGQARLASER
mmetsp:Transcript_63652/g.153718  ORF Transcript_63652/g.153718 Transcript_63652/m.153718 type:complete len:276 (+) Transcript_63652:1492-2319(+)